MDDIGRKIPIPLHVVGILNRMETLMEGCDTEEVRTIFKARLEELRYAIQYQPVTCPMFYHHDKEADEYTPLNPYDAMMNVAKTVLDLRDYIIEFARCGFTKDSFMNVQIDSETQTTLIRMMIEKPQMYDELNRFMEYTKGIRVHDSTYPDMGCQTLRIEYVTSKIMQTSVTMSKNSVTDAWPGTPKFLRLSFSKTKAQMSEEMETTVKLLKQRVMDARGIKYKSGFEPIKEAFEFWFDIGMVGTLYVNVRKK